MAKDLGDDDLDLDHEEIQEEEFVIHTGPVDCENSEGGVGIAARRLGVTCQELFRLAYVEKGFSDSYSRAVFVLYIDTNRSAIPPIVFNFCMEVAKKGTFTNTDQCGTCVACTMKHGSWPGLVMAYRWIAPEVTKETLLGHVKAKPPTRKNPNEQLEAYRQKLFDKVFESGALDDDVGDDWASLLRD